MWPSRRLFNPQRTQRETGHHMSGGFDTASIVSSGFVTSMQSAHGDPDYWIRYFDPCPYTSLNSSSANANNECRAIYHSTGPALSPLSSPAQSRLNGTSAEGQADATTFVNSIKSAYTAVATMVQPTSGMLYCWLDQEASTSLSLSYWKSWANYINTTSLGGSGAVFYAGLYCNPGSAYPNCSTIAGASGTTGHCNSVWSSEPEYSNNSLSSPPTYNPDTCSAAPSNLWQFHENLGSSTVDLDSDNFSGGLQTRSFKFSGSP